jgi:uncharacterized protein YkwD
MTSRILWFRVLLLPSIVFTFGIENSTARADDVGTLEQKVHALVNEHRATIGLEPLNYSEDIALVARQHSRDMAKGYVGHGHEGAEERGRALASTFHTVSLVKTSAGTPTTPHRPRKQP